MGMIRGTDNYSIDILAHFFEHFAEVIIFLSLGELFTLLAKGVIIDIAETNHFAKSARLIDVATTFATNAYASKAKAFKSRFLFLCASNATCQPKASPSNGSLFNKTTTIRLSNHFKSLLNINNKNSTTSGIEVVKGWIRI